MKKFDEIICLISSRLNQGFQMKKDQTIAGEKNLSGWTADIRR